MHIGKYEDIVRNNFIKRAIIIKINQYITQKQDEKEVEEPPTQNNSNENDIVQQFGDDTHPRLLIDYCEKRKTSYNGKLQYFRDNAHIKDYVVNKIIKQKQIKTSNIKKQSDLRKYLNFRVFSQKTFHETINKFLDL